MAQQQSAQIAQQSAAVAQAQAAVKADAATVAAAQQTIAATAATTQRAGWAANTTVSSYGEIGYSRPTNQVSASNTDVQRAVIGMQHRFDDKTRMVAEWEWEHAITSADDTGESEVEQLWVEREFDNGVKGRAGLFLMPVGLLNQYHEPTAYYGVYRPDTDTKIIPSTWREVGLGANTDLGNGLNLDVALTTAPNLSGWDAGSTEARDRGPLQSIHGEGQFAAARTFGTVAALNWRGIPGLWVGGSAVFDNIGQSQPGFSGNGAKLFMIEGHARYQVGGLDLAAEAVRGQINGATRFNRELATGDFESPTLVPHLFYGGYVQAAYNIPLSGDYKLNAVRALRDPQHRSRLRLAAGVGRRHQAARREDPDRRRQPVHRRRHRAEGRLPRLPPAQAARHRRALHARQLAEPGRRLRVLILLPRRAPRGRPGRLWPRFTASAVLLFRGVAVQDGADGRGHLGLPTRVGVGPDGRGARGHHQFGLMVAFFLAAARIATPFAMSCGVLSRNGYSRSSGRLMPGT